MGLFDDERLTISVTQAQRGRLGGLAKRAGRAVTIGRAARTALDKGLDTVSAAMDQVQAAAETARPEAQADRREAARLAGQA